MTNKRCMVFETLGKVSDLQVMECANPKEVRLTGVFGVCGIKNQNNRVYDKENYAQMVESLQKVIKTEGCPGELEHPNSMNINLENVSHKIESIQMNEDGTITGTILLLNTPKGQIAKAIVEGGLPLYISSRGSGTITTEGKVTLSTIKTYDLVGTPGFSQAKLTLSENQSFECLNESLENGNITWAIVEDNKSNDLNDNTDQKDNSTKDDDLLDDKKDDTSSDDKPNEKSADKKSADKKSDDEKSDDEKSDDKKSDDKKSDDKKSDDKENNNDNKKDNKNVTMNDIKKAIDQLTDQVKHLEAELHIAQESLAETKESIPTVNYEAIEKWVTEEFKPEFKEELANEAINTPSNITSKTVEAKISEAVENVTTSLKKWITEEFATEIQNWITEEFAPKVQKWITEEYSPEVQKWMTEEFAPKIQNWVVEEFAPEVQNWITEEYSPTIESWINEEYSGVLNDWITEEFAPHYEELIKESVNNDVAKFLETQRAGRLDDIDALLESIESNENVVDKIVKEEKNANKFKGIYVVENMPAEYKPSWEMLNEEKQNEIIRSSKMYDFTKEGVLESFWSNVKFENEEKQVKENKEIQSDFHNSVVNQMMRLRNI